MHRSKLSQEQVFDLLKNSRRRYALYCLRRQGDPVTLADLTDQVAAWEHGMAPAELTSAQRKTVYISLYQTHVPKLDDVGLINYDRETGEIDLSRCARALDTYLVDKPGLMIRWNRYYLVLSLMSIMLLGGVWFKVDPSALLSSLMATMIIVTAYSLLAILQYLIYRRRIVPATPPELRRIEGQ